MSAGQGRHCLRYSPSPEVRFTWVIHGTWAEDIETHLGPCVDVVDETLEELTPVVLTVVDRVVSLAPQDGGELGPVSKKPQRSETESKVQSSPAGRVQ
jgi:hypothetical protein